MSDLLERDAGNAAIAERSDDSPPPGPSSDADLVRRFVRTRDEEAFVELERRYGPLVRGVCARTLARNEDREDVYQATFLTLFLKAGRIRRRGSAACWLYGVAWRIATRLRRKRRLEGTEAIADLPADVQDVWVQIDRKYMSEVLDAELQALPARDRLPLAMHYLMGLSHQEIGRSLGLTPAAVDGRLKRARNRLRSRLLSRGVGVASALAYAATTVHEAQAASATAEAAARGYELFRLFDGGASASPDLSHAQGLYAEEAGMIATGWGKSMAVAGGVALACGGAVGIFWQGSFGPGVVQAQMGGMGGGYGGGGFGGDPFAQPRASGPVVTVRMAGDQPAPESPEDAFFKPLSEPPNTISLLSGITETDFLEQPLEIVLDALAAQTGLEIQIDRKALEELAVPADQSVTIQTSAMTTEDVLDTILEPLNLTYVAKERFLLITSQDRASSQMETRMYAVEDHPLLRSADGNAIVNAIVGHVAPESWNEMGGAGSVSLLPGVLIVTNDQRTLAKVEDFLAQYGKLLAKYEPADQAGMDGMSSSMGGSPYGAGMSSGGVFGTAANPYAGGASGFSGGVLSGEGAGGFGGEGPGSAPAGESGGAPPEGGAEGSLTPGLPGPATGGGTVPGSIPGADIPGAEGSEGSGGAASGAPGSASGSVTPGGVFGRAAGNPAAGGLGGGFGGGGSLGGFQ